MGFDLRQRIFLPAYSPDLNIIENVWGNCKRDILYNAKEPSTSAELSGMVRASWDSVTSDTCQNLVASMNRRLEMITMSDGYPLRY